jgi:FKBP-type peptidyl-prolyl cis-trans isomerase FklB
MQAKSNFDKSCLAPARPHLPAARINYWKLSSRIPLTLFLVAINLATGAALADEKVDLSDRMKRDSYAMGMDVVRGLKIDDFDIDLKAIGAGIADMQAGTPALSPEEQHAAMKQMQADILAKAVAKKEALGVIHKKEGTAFLEANATKPGVRIMDVTAPDKSTAQLQYKVLESGTGGASPQMTDTVTVRYRGTFIDGKEFDIFDNSVKHGDTAIFKMADVIPGWAAALKVMKPGDKWQLFVPPSLAYADFGPPEIGMYTTLIYELELVSFAPTNDTAGGPQ